MKRWVGMESGEALQIKFTDNVDLDNKIIHLYPHMTKSQEARSIPLTKRAAQVLEKRSKEFRGRLFPYRNSTMGHLFLKVRKRMGLENDKEFVLHALRHTCASRMVMQGVELNIVQRILGHSSISVTQRYAHLGVRNLRVGIAALEGYTDEYDEKG